MPYTIKPYTKAKADKLGVIVAPSQHGKYKIDVFDKDKNYLMSIGHIDYSDYPTYIRSHGLEFANERRRLYKIRHEKDRKKLYSRGYYADQLLW